MLTSLYKLRELRLLEIKLSIYCVSQVFNL